MIERRIYEAVFGVKSLLISVTNALMILRIRVNGQIKRLIGHYLTKIHFVSLTLSICIFDSVEVQLKWFTLFHTFIYMTTILKRYYSDIILYIEKKSNYQNGNDSHFFTLIAKLTMEQI